jgi:hypothetical protein
MQWYDWYFEKEDWSAFADLQDDTEVIALMNSGVYREVPLDPRKILRCENQGSQGSCRGHSGSTGAEWIRVLATKEFDVQLSRAMMYYETQRIDRLSGDVGSTIMGGIKLLSTVGLCEEKLWPYPPRYNNARPANFQAVLDNAAPHRIAKAIRLTSYDGIRAFVGSGQGYVDCGIPWSSRYAAPVVEQWVGGNGGHAIGLFSLSERKDSSGRPYIWMFNSHGEESGVAGWSEWSPRMIEQAIRQQMSVFVGVSDMPHLKPRTFTIEDMKKAMRKGLAA